MNVKKITLVFETCDAVSIPIDLVRELVVQHSWETMTCDGAGKMRRSMECSVFSLTLEKKAGELVTQFSTNTEPDGVMLEEKISQRDVVSADLVMDDGSEIQCTPNWRDDGCGSNAAMVIHTDDDSVIRFTIS